MFKFKKSSPTLQKAQIKETKSEPGSNSSSNQVTPITLLNRKRISLKSLYNSKKKSLRKRGSRKEKSEEKSERERSEDTQISERENPKKILSHPDKFDLISLPNNTDFNSNFETLSDNFWHDAVSGSVKNSFDTDQQILAETTHCNCLNLAKQISNNEKISHIIDIEKARSVQVRIKDGKVTVSGEERFSERKGNQQSDKDAINHRNGRGKIIFEKSINLPKFVIENNLEEEVYTRMHVDTLNGSNTLEVIYPEENGNNLKN